MILWWTKRYFESKCNLERYLAFSPLRVNAFLRDTIFSQCTKVMGWSEACEIVSGVRGIARWVIGKALCLFLLHLWLICQNLQMLINISFLLGWRNREGWRQLALAGEVPPLGEILFLQCPI